MNLTKVKFHGNIFEDIKESYSLAVKSVGEAMHAINTMTSGKLYKALYDNDKKGIKYEVLINKRKVIIEKISEDEYVNAYNSELAMKFSKLETIDIVPVIEGGNSGIGAIIAGVLLIIVGIVLQFVPGGGPIGVALIIGGIGLIAAGVINLLTAPPKFDDFRQIQGGGGKQSYLFNGPQNVTQEGGPVPVGYGTLLVGSQVISASYEVTEQTAKSTLTT